MHVRTLSKSIARTRLGLFTRGVSPASGLWLAMAACGGCSAADSARSFDSAGQPIGQQTASLTATTMPAPIGYWRFDDCVQGSTSFRDSSGGNLLATASGGVSCSPSGHPGIAGAFDGAAGQLQVPDSPVIDGALTKSLTVAGWVKPTDVPTSSNHSYAIMTKWSNGVDSFKLQLTSGGYKFTIAIASGTSSEQQIAIVAPTSFSSTSWTHVAGVYDATAGKVTLYINGTQAASANATGALRTSTAPIRIGNSPTMGAINYGFHGLIDEAWLASSALSASQVAALVAGPHADALGPCFEQPKLSKVLLVIYSPFLPDKNQDLMTYLGGNDPQAFSASIVESARASSHGLVNYQIVDTRILNEWAPQRPGAKPLNETNFFNPPPDTGYTVYPGGSADYAALFNEQQICSLVQNQNLSEVWVWAPNLSNTMGFGFDEFAYKIPNDNVPFSSQINNPWFYQYRMKNIPDCGKTVWVMGWNTEVGLDNAIHSYNHRVESIASIVVGQGRWYDAVDPQNPWRLFSLYDHAYPGLAQVGNVHYPPNGGAGGVNAPNGDYDYGNMIPVSSTAADWLNYPSLTGATASANCTAWGCTQLGYQQWYESHLPHVAGTSYGGSCNNWWTYVADYDRRLTNCSGTGCNEQLALGAVCAGDDQCASGWCACKGTGPQMVCSAPNTPKTCPAGNWAPCSVDADCISMVCGCNGGPPPKVCLPNSQYPRTCN